MNNNQETYKIKRLDADNLGDLHILYNAVYGRLRPAGFFSRKYDTAYTGAAYIGFIAYNAQMEPVSYYGVIPCLIRIGDETVLSAQSADTMTHPDYRKQKLFITLAEQTFELCGQLGIGGIFGFPNQNSLHACLKYLDWQHADTMDCFVIPVKTVPLELLAFKASFLKRLYAVYCRRILKACRIPQSGIRGSVVPCGHDGVLRDDHYLQYKTYSDTQVIRIGGAVLWIKTSNGLQIGDIEGDFTGVMPALLKLAKKLGLRQIQFHASPGTELHAFFAAHYQAQVSFPVLVRMTGAGMPMDKIKFTLADIDIF